MSDAIIIERGLLGITLPLEKIPIAQKWMINLCNLYSKPVLVATHILESMIENPRPTRAESSDIFGTVLDGVDAIVLCRETTIGKYPIEAVKFLNNCMKEAEILYDYEYYWSTKEKAIESRVIHDFKLYELKFNVCLSII